MAMDGDDNQQLDQCERGLKRAAARSFAFPLSECTWHVAHKRHN